jgi:hypothetical protein
MLGDKIEYDETQWKKRGCSNNFLLEFIVSSFPVSWSCSKTGGLNKATSANNKVVLEFATSSWDEEKKTKNKKEVKPKWKKY